MVAWRDWLLSQERADRAELPPEHSGGALSLSALYKTGSGGRGQRCAAASSSELSPYLQPRQTREQKGYVSIAAAAGLHVLASMDGHSEGEPGLMVCLVPCVLLCVHECHSTYLTGGPWCCPPTRLLKSQRFLWNLGFCEGV